MNNSPFFIYPIGPQQLQILRELAVQTFEETFASTNTRENMDIYFSRAFNESILDKELSQKESWWYFIEFNGILAGYLKVNVRDAQTELREDAGFEVERIYVLEAYYGQGVGAELMEFAIRQARSKKKKYLWLGVHEENYRALRFYEKFGLKAFSDHVFMMGDQPQRDILMKLDL